MIICIIILSDKWNLKQVENDICDCNIKSSLLIIINLMNSKPALYGQITYRKTLKSATASFLHEIIIIIIMRLAINLKGSFFALP